MKKFLVVLSSAVLLIGVCATANAVPITFDLKGTGGDLGSSTYSFFVGGANLTVFAYRISKDATGTIRSTPDIHQNYYADNLNPGKYTGGLGVESPSGGPTNKIDNDIYYSNQAGDTGFLEFLVIQRPSSNYVFTSVTLTDFGPTEYATLKGGMSSDGSNSSILTTNPAVNGNQLGTAIFAFSGADNFDYLVVGNSYARYFYNEDGSVYKENKLSAFRVGGVTLEYTDPPVPAVPEPATMFLLGSGLIGVGAFVRRKFKR